jgi:hypothetical protein
MVKEAPYGYFWRSAVTTDCRISAERRSADILSATDSLLALPALGPRSARFARFAVRPAILIGGVAANYIMQNRFEVSFAGLRSTLLERAKDQSGHIIEIIAGGLGRHPERRLINAEQKLCSVSAAGQNCE